MRNPFDKILNWYFTKNSLPYWIILLIDCAIVMFSGVLTYWIFNDAVTLFENTLQVINTVMIFVLLSIPGFRIFHTYSGFMRYSSFVDLMRVAYCNGVTFVLAWIAEHFTCELPCDLFVCYNTTSIFLIFIIATLLMWALRIFVKTLYDVAFSNTRAMRILIYGAMSGGVGLAKYIRSQRPRKYVVKGFITHYEKAKHQEIMGQKVYTISDDIADVIRKNDIEAVMVSPLRVKGFRDNQELQDIIIGAGAKIYMAQGAVEMDQDQLDENANIDYTQMQLREVSVEELLPRSEIRVDMKSIGELLTGQRVLVTGAAGSIGSEICRQVAKLNPAAMLLIDQAETPEHDIRLMMMKEFPHIPAETVVTSICKEKRMEELFKRFRPDYVFHAAAYKHVPMMEDNPSEAVQNNIYGTKVIADLSVKYGVKKFVMVSTDKAVNPTNVMGCSKRICEIYVQSLDLAIKTRRIGAYMEKLGNANSFVTAGQIASPTARTQFVTTRFGNVLGSNGSVIPLFREQIKNGGPVTVTDERIVRFFMLIPEACKLVLEAGTKGNGGEIFVFDMGKPVKIADLAKRMIKLSGAKNVEIKFTGLRPGEKLYEEVLNELEGTKPTFHEKIRIAEVREYAYDQVCKDINELIEISQHYDDMATVAKMKQIVPEYKSNNSVYEKLDK
ncbi:polysaccharide biosynthesis protein [Xylanibacter ruminicola]|uniref:polysaccharide biosynthesis protein n=1 Tax=Xylanibacter ruminicola TaxID=839 RepID=UPI00049113FB|nr:nucleoside-diphosphate sugar epimerase/dehydratase [Xylanibacter ruminicola]